MTLSDRKLFVITPSYGSKLDIELTFQVRHLGDFLGPWFYGFECSLRPAWKIGLISKSSYGYCTNEIAVQFNFNRGRLLILIFSATRVLLKPISSPLGDLSFMVPYILYNVLLCYTRFF